MKNLFSVIALASLLTVPALSHADDKYIGEIFLFAGTYCPKDSHEADGTPLAIKDYNHLFSIIGTIYGGDGRTTFALPIIDTSFLNKKGTTFIKSCIVLSGVMPNHP